METVALKLNRQTLNQATCYYGTIVKLWPTLWFGSSSSNKRQRKNNCRKVTLVKYHSRVTDGDIRRRLFVSCRRRNSEHSPPTVRGLIFSFYGIPITVYLALWGVNNRRDHLRYLL